MREEKIYQKELPRAKKQFSHFSGIWERKNQVGEEPRDLFCNIYVKIRAQAFLKQFI